DKTCSSRDCHFGETPRTRQPRAERRLHSHASALRPGTISLGTLLGGGYFPALIPLSLHLPALHRHGSRRMDRAAGRAAHPCAAGSLPRFLFFLISGLLL